MTDNQIIERLAEFMGWKKGVTMNVWHDGACIHLEWNPLESWNHWRQVEVSVRLDADLWHEFMHEIDVNTSHVGTPSAATAVFSATDLPTRCKALASIIFPN